MNLTSRLALAILSWILSAGTAIPVFAQPAKKLLVIGVDGLRPDALMKANTPHFDRLAREGAFATNTLIQGDRYKASDTISGPGWSSLLTGVWADKHGVHDNNFTGRNYGQYPHFFARLKKANPEAKTYSFVSWAPIDEFIVSGADVRHVETRPPGQEQVTDLCVSAGDINTRDGAWHHLVGVRKDKTLSLYLDGRRVESMADSTGGFRLGGALYFFGRDTRSGPTELEGELGPARIWSRALTETEIQDIARKGPEAGPLAATRDEGLRAQLAKPGLGSRLPLGQVSDVTLNDFTLEAWFRTTDPGRGILMGNFAPQTASLNLELHTDNRVRLYLDPGTGRSATLGALQRENLMDSNLVSRAIHVLRNDDPTAMFVYFHQADSAGHSLGFGPNFPEYIRAIENVDGHVGRLIEAIRSRPSYANEDWLICVCADHGGLDTRHDRGHQDPEILNVLLIFNGRSVPAGRIARQTYLVDLAPTALTHLGVPIDPAWQLDGQRPF
jgi:hypothetical protein